MLWGFPVLQILLVGCGPAWYLEVPFLRDSKALSQEASSS
jgi:hypothetical protein